MYMSSPVDLGFTITVKTLNGLKPYHYVLVEHPNKTYINPKTMTGVSTFCNSPNLDSVKKEAYKLANLLGIPLEKIKYITVN